MSHIQSDPPFLIDPLFDQEELIDGKRIASPRPAGPGILACSMLQSILGPPMTFRRGGPGGWWIVSEPEVHFSRAKLIPDVAGWHKERMPQVLRDHRFEVVPDWLCEVISEGSRKIDRITKPPVYLSEGVKHFWLIDPELRTLEVFEAIGGRWVVLGTFSDDTIVTVEPFPSVEVDLLLLWGAPRPTTST